MPTPNHEAIGKVLTDFIKLGRNVGLSKVIKPLEKFRAQFEVAKPTFKVLRGPLHAAYSVAFIEIRQRVYDRIKDRPRPGLKKQSDEFFRLSKEISDLVFPPDVSETEVVGLARNKESTTVIGAPEEAKKIAAQSLDVVERFSKAVFKKDIGAAYKLCANEFRTTASIEQLRAALTRADTKFGGPAVDLKIERNTWIYADAAARKRSNSRGDWPKETPKPNKRALVGAFWFTDKKQDCGRSVFCWVSEEVEGYRIAKFKQYLQ